VGGQAEEVVMDDVEDEEEMAICFGDKDLHDGRSILYPGDLVEFDIVRVRRTGKTHATRVRLVERARRSRKQHGVISAIKDRYGFIENQSCDQEVFFHFRHGSCFSHRLFCA
jgi:cold shock CspA family protein